MDWSRSTGSIRTSPWIQWTLITGEFSRDHGQHDTGMFRHNLHHTGYQAGKENPFSATELSDDICATVDVQFFEDHMQHVLHAGKAGRGELSLRR